MRVENVMGMAVLLLIAIPADAAIVRFKVSGAALSPVVRLQDVADVYGADAEQVARLQDVTLAPAPAAGQAKWIDHATVRERLRAFGFNLADIEFTGSSRIRVMGPVTAPREERPAPRVTRPEPPPVAPQSASRRAASPFQIEQAEHIVTEAVQRYVGRHAPEVGAVSVEVQLAAAQIEPLLAAAKDGCRIVGGLLVWGQPQPFALEYRDAHGAARAVTVTCRVAPQPVVLAVRHDVSRGQVVQASDLVWTQVPAVEEAITQPEAVVGCEATRTLREGEPVQTGDVQSVPLIRSGDIVSLWVRRRGLSVRQVMKSRGNGALGETVTLTTLDNRETVTARVTGFHEAETLAAASLSAPSAPIQFLSAETPPP